MSFPVSVNIQPAANLSLSEWTLEYKIYDHFQESWLLTLHIEIPKGYTCQYTGLLETVFYHVSGCKFIDISHKDQLTTKHQK